MGKGVMFDGWGDGHKYGDVLWGVEGRLGAGSQGLIEGLGVKRKLSSALLERVQESKWIGPSQYTSMIG